MDNKHREERLVNLIKNNKDFDELTEKVNTLLCLLNSNEFEGVEKFFKQHELILLQNELGLRVSQYV